MDWCEDNYQVTGYIAEFWNTLSNIGILVPACYGIWRAHKEGVEKRFTTLHFMLVLIGVGSTVFHMTLKHSMQLLDELPMVWSCCYMVYTMHTVSSEPGTGSIPAALLLSTYTMGFTLAYVFVPRYEVFCGMFATIAAVMIIQALITLKTRKSSRASYLFCAACFFYILGFALWNLDTQLCSKLQQLRSTMPDVLRPLLQLHAWWHFAAGAASYLNVLHIIHHRKVYLEFNLLKLFQKGLRGADNHTLESPPVSQSLEQSMEVLRKGGNVEVPQLMQEMASSPVTSIEGMSRASTSLNWVKEVKEALVGRLGGWAQKELEGHLKAKTVWWPVEDFKISICRTVEELSACVVAARSQGKTLRVCGSQHSAPRVVFDHDKTKEEKVIAVKLDGDFRKTIHLGDGLFKVGGGVNLGVNPIDPTSTAENSFNQIADRLGYALPILGGVSHQTVSGFMLTGSTGGSFRYGNPDYIVSFDIMDGLGQVRHLERDTDEHNAAAVSMGLFGVIVQLTIQCQRTYLVKGEEQTVRYEDSCLRDGDSWVESMMAHTYNHSLWFPSKAVNSVLQYTANQNFEIGEKIQPYRHPLPTHALNIIAGVGLWLVNKMNRQGMRNLLDFLLKVMNPIDKKPRVFNDHWWKALANDDGCEADTCVRFQFTEICIEVDQANEVIEALKEMFKDQDTIGNFGLEMYMSKKSPHWMSMAYNHDVLRVGRLYFEYNSRGSLDKYFEQIWDVLLNRFPGARLHWGKHLPPVGTTYSGTAPDGTAFSKTVGPDWCRKSYARFDDWIEMRKSFDPDNIFVTKYWKEMFGL